MGYKHTDAHKEKLRTDNPGGNATAKGIIAISTDTFEVVKTYKSASEASMELIGGINGKANINAACRRNKTRAPYGFYWRYVGEYDPNEDYQTYNTIRSTPIRNSRTVLQLNVDGNIIREWGSVNDICKEFRASPSTLRKVINSSEEWKGFIWKDKS